MLWHVTTRLTAASALALVVFAGALPGAVAGSVELSLEVSSSTGSAADTFVATVQLGVPGEHGPERYWPPVFTDFALVDEQSHRTMVRQYDPQSGQMFKVSQEHRYVLRPLRTGRLTIEGARMRVDGREYETPPAVIDVYPAGADAEPDAAPSAKPRAPTTASGIDVPGFEPPSRASLGSDRPEMFVHVAVDREVAYVGQQITVTWLLYTRHEVLKFEPSMPRLDDFWSEILYEPNAYFRYDEAVVAGVTYRVVPVSKRALFPTRPGKLTIGSYRARVSSLYTRLGRASALASKPVEIQVEPLPPGAPPGFDPSYVGTFSVDTEVDRRRIDAGESLTLSVTVSGQGAIRRTTPPVLQIPGFAFREPRDFDETTHASTSVVSGERTYRYWATPQRGGTQTIPAVTIHYFNPRSEAYEQASSRPIEIEVTGDPAEMTAAARHGARDLRAIRHEVTISSRSVSQPYRSPWFWLAAVLPLLCFVSVSIIDRVRVRASDDATSTRKLGSSMRKRLRVAELHMHGGRSAQLFGELERILYACLEQRLAAPVHFLTRDELEQLLAQKGFARPLIERIRSELEQCDFGRFAATAAESEEMKSALRRVETLAHDIATTSPGGDRERTEANL